MAQRDTFGTVPYCTHHLLPAATEKSLPSLTAGYQTDRTQPVFHCGLLSASIIVTEGLRLDRRKFSLVEERGMREGAKVISLRQLLLARNHSEIHYLPADPLTRTSIWPPPRLAAFLPGNQITVLYREKGPQGIMGIFFFAPSTRGPT